MIVKVKLMGALREKTPDGGEVSVDDGATINDVLHSLDIAAPQVQIVLVNGKPQPNRDTAISADDELTVLAPVGGG